MKKIKKTILLLSIIILLIQSNVLAVTRFAEYDDSTADQQRQEELEEQEECFNESIGKSTNNYLKELQVEGYEISPKFDKQTEEYTIEQEINGDEINIIAVPSDEKAKVEGAGKVKLDSEDNIYKIKVTAESGTVRIYSINIGKKEDEIVTETANEMEENIPEFEEEIINVDEYLQQKENNKFIITILAIIIIVIIIIIFVFKLKNKKKHGKHYK